MKTKKSSLRQVVKNAAITTGLLSTLVTALNTEVKTEVTEGQFVNPSNYHSNFFTYKGDVRNPTGVSRVPQIRFEPDYIDETTSLRVFGKHILSLDTKRKIPNPETLSGRELGDKIDYIEGDLSEKDKSITTEDGTKYVVQNVGHDSVAYIKQK